MHVTTTPDYRVNFFVLLTLTPLLIYAPCEWCVFVLGFVGGFFCFTFSDFCFSRITIEIFVFLFVIMQLPDFTQAHEGQPSEPLGPSFRSCLQVLIHREVDGQVSVDGLVPPNNFIP